MTRPLPSPAGSPSPPAAESPSPPAAESETAFDAELPALHRRSLPMPGQEDLAVELFAHIAALHPGVPAALLDSSDHARSAHPERSRHSILAFSLGEHAAEVQHRAGQTRELAATGEHVLDLPFFEWLRRSWQPAQELPQDSPNGSRPSGAAQLSEAGASPFALGWIGWLGYELAQPRASPEHPPSREHPASPKHQPSPEHAAPWVAGPPCTSSAEPAVAQHDARLFRATHAVVLDHRTGSAEVQSWGEDPAWTDMVAEALTAAASNAEPSAGAAATPESAPPTLPDPPLQVRDSRQAYLAKIRAAQEEIAAGNSYEICLTTAVTGTLREPPDGVALFRALRRANRAPFTQYLRFDDVEILSTSPERFLSLDAAGTARSEPIKGTRPRGTTAAEDQALRQDLMDHPKDRAENVMITDLVRNDLSVHAVPGTLRTERLCAVESYPTVHQMVSTVSARTTPGTHPAQVVSAAFPPGSMTGAPKISTMEILERLETGPRGPYSGVAGYFSSTGAADLSVLIRTVVLSCEDAGDARFHLGLGGAITADSDPEAEWEEVVTKSVGVLGALGAQFPDQVHKQ